MATKKAVSPRKNTDQPAKVKKSKPVLMRRRLPKSKVYLITAAQNATPVHAGFWASLQHCAKFYNAEIVVIPGRYKNPTSQWTQANNDHEWWAPEVAQHLFNGRRKLTDRLIILGDVKVQWATRSPLSGMDTLTKNMSGIMGHSNLAVRSIPTPKHKHPKIMFTTGACTVPNYTDTKTGKLGEFNHCLGALIVETDGEIFFPREMNWSHKTSSFIDLDMEFTPEGPKLADNALSTTLGDIHHRFILEEVVKATFTAKTSITNLLNPKYIVYNDLNDSHARNHHHRGDWLSAAGKWKAGKECVRTEIEESVEFVNKMTPKGSKAIVVSSNHDRAIDRWLKETDFRSDPVNAEFYLEMALKTFRSTRMGGGGVEHDDPFITYAKTIARPGVRFLKQGESFVLADVEYGLHGDAGPNGSRGTTKNLSIIGQKVTKGHSHVAEIIDGCYSTGTSTGSLEYEGGGPSAHSNAHVIQYANGKRTIIFIINGRWCLERTRRLGKKMAALRQ